MEKQIIQKKLLKIIVAFMATFFSLSASCAQCIEISSIVETVRTSPILDNIIVKGKASVKCDSVIISVTCNNKVIERRANVNFVGQWELTLTYGELKGFCGCGSSMQVVAKCMKGTCEAESTKVLCSECPTVSLDDVEASCLTSGNVKVSYTVNVSGSLLPEGVVRLHKGIGPAFEDIPTAGPFPYNGSFEYDCSRYGNTYTLYVSATGCSTSPTNSIYSSGVDVEVPNCSCPISGPIVVEAVSECRKKFSLQLNECVPTDAIWFWNFGDGNEDNSGNASTEHAFREGTWTVEAFLAGAGDECKRSVSITIPKDCGPCQPNCAGKSCGGDGCGGSCGYCPAGKQCDDGDCVNEARNDDDDCGFLGLGCIEFNLCWMLALLVAAAVALRLILLANFGWSITIGTSVTLDVILEALNLVLVITLLGLCPCEVPVGILLGVLIAVIWILVQWGMGALPPFWLQALIVAVGLVVAALSYRALQCD